MSWGYSNEQGRQIPVDTVVILNKQTEQFHLMIGAIKKIIQEMWWRQIAGCFTLGDYKRLPEEMSSE